MSEAMLWNKNKTASVRYTKIRSFTINDVSYLYGSQLSRPNKWSLKGWYDPNDCFEFGDFDREQDAKDFLTAIHTQIEKT